MHGSPLLGALSSGLALIIAGISAGPAIVLGSLFLLAFLLSPRYGLLTRLPRCQQP